MWIGVNTHASKKGLMVALIALVCGTGLKTCLVQKTRLRSTSLLPSPRIERKHVETTEWNKSSFAASVPCASCAHFPLCALYKPETASPATSVIPVIWLHKLTTSKKCWKAGISQ